MPKYQIKNFAFVTEYKYGETNEIIESDKPLDENYLARYIANKYNFPHVVMINFTEIKEND